MSNRLDVELQALRADPFPGLDGLEQDVWRGINSAREARKATAVFVPVRAASIVAALGIGIGGGAFAASAVATEAHEISVFSLDAHLAPSTLLGGSHK